MKLRDLIPPDNLQAADGDIEITGITADSRAVKPDNLFVAVPGSKTDGLRFIPQAVAAGAAAVMAEQKPADIPLTIAFVEVPNARRALALAAAKFFPRQPRTVAAVTGTSGKTSVAAFTRQIWQALGHAAASVGTVGIVWPGGEIYGSLTTPDPIELHRTLEGLAADGVTHLAMEASSHGLDQFRLDGVRIAAGAFTNLSRDHLDYHPSVEAYLNAKLRLFEDLVATGGSAVVANDHPESKKVIDAARVRGLRVLTVGRTGHGIKLIEATIDGNAQRLTLEHAGRRFSLRLPLVGAFQVENALVAAGLALMTGGDPAQVFPALETLQGAKGRLEQVGDFNGAPIFVDYAHKPDALDKALDALRPYVRRELVVVFGCGGDRDPGKREIMGAIASDKADKVVVTNDNPRSENPAAIRAAILRGARFATEIGDRGEAIRQSIAALQKGDVLLIAGKGHETGQIVGERTLPFSDHEAVAAALGDLKA
jgi:UDP-N-acetylmuramoyl-L-alanyl-D-glutamate--2,6-diaminopimelate ligase